MNYLFYVIFLILVVVSVGVGSYWLTSDSSCTVAMCSVFLYLGLYILAHHRKVPRDLILILPDIRGRLAELEDKAISVPRGSKITDLRIRQVAGSSDVCKWAELKVLSGLGGKLEIDTKDTWLKQTFFAIGASLVFLVVTFGGTSGGVSVALSRPSSPQSQVVSSPNKEGLKLGLATVLTWSQLLFSGSILLYIRKESEKALR